jgi:hypothetical protein
MEESKSQNLADVETQNTSDDSISSIFLKHKDNIETISKSFVLLLGIAYVIGLLILNFQLRNSGIHYLNFLQLEYVLVGTLWLFLTFTTYSFLIGTHIYVKSIFSANTANRLKRISKALIILIAQLAILLNIIQVLSDYQLPFTQRSAWIAIGVLLLHALSFNSILHSIKGDFRIVGLFSVLKGNTWNIVFTTMYYLIVFVCGISTYSNFLFPNLSSVYGGGKKQVVEFIVKEEFVPTLQILGVKIDKETKKTEKLEVILESDDDFVISQPIQQNNESKVKSIRIKKDEIDATLYLDNKLSEIDSTNNKTSSDISINESNKSANNPDNNSNTNLSK